MTVGVIGNPNYQYLSMGLNWGIGYDLPNTTDIMADIQKLSNADFKQTSDKFGDILMQRRHRRQLYNKLEILIKR